MRAAGVYNALLRCYPTAFREEYGTEMLLAFSDQLAEARRSRDRLRQARLWLAATLDLFTIAPKEHWHVTAHDIRYALRTFAANPAFAAAAILSLALGIGANTAIYSLWHGVLESPLPVRNPSELVLLTDPRYSGVAIGSQSGERGLLTYTEFEQLRDRASVFSVVMASESSLERRQVRIGSGDWEQANARLVSATYFDTLGVAPAAGRLLTAADHRTPAAVISYQYWQRRFSGRADVIGKNITVQKALLSIIGVAPRTFFGEAVGQQPDIWIPLGMQKGVLPGRDWLHDAGTDKVMWLHVFARLRPGVTIAQAQENANAIFRAGIEAYYGSVTSPEARRGFLDQKLRLRPGSAGVSEMRGLLTESLRYLFAAVGILLLIACANLANLLLARGTARQREIALRLSLGATRGRLVRQLFTESIVLAFAGGLAGLVAAYALHGVLVRLITQIAPQFAIDFALDGRVLAFSIAATAVAALLFGMLPAWLATGVDTGAALNAEGRTTTGSAGRLRWGKLLVIAQLALSLPLLAGAGLLARTLYNLQNADLGFPREHVLLARVDAESGGYELNRRGPLLRDLLEQIRHVPGVQGATFSENGVLSGHDSADLIQVEGYTSKGRNDRGSRWDQVGPQYFSTLGIPIIMGREITEADQGGSTKVCVINEAFRNLFFENRNPLGMHITNVYGDKRTTCEIVGVAKDAHTDAIRPPQVRPRYYVPTTQPLAEFGGATFEVRVSHDMNGVAEGLRRAIHRVDPTLPIVSLDTLDERVQARIALERVMAGLAAAFAVSAVGLAAIGLYGVLAYGTTRRRTEIGIRIALGAQPTRVIAMILRETSHVLIAGLILGGVLAYIASRWISSQLYGLAPHDPLTLTVATAVLVIIALGAAYLPARRVSRLDPVSALRQ